MTDERRQICHAKVRHADVARDGGHWHRRWPGCATVWLLAALASACTLDNPRRPAPELDFQTFRCVVEPVLARECAFPACHGNTARRFQVLAPGRMRLASEYERALANFDPADAEAGIHPPLTYAEAQFNYAQALGWAGDGSDSELLLRPLPAGAGGIHHAAGADVFPSTDSPGYQALARWLAGETIVCP